MTASSATPRCSRVYRVAGRRFFQTSRRCSKPVALSHSHLRQLSSKGIFMRLVRLRAPGGLENLKPVEEDHPKPRPGELLVRIRANSLNFHDDLVVLGKIPCADGRIPMSDGAGEVIAVGDDVNEFKVADNVWVRQA